MTEGAPTASECDTTIITAEFAATISAPSLSVSKTQAELNNFMETPQQW